MKKYLLFTAIIVALTTIKVFGQTKQEVPGSIKTDDFGAVKAVECMPNATFSQASINVLYSVTSNIHSPSNIFQYIEAFPSSIQTIRFFGVQGIEQGGNTVAQDLADSLNFVINIQANNDDALGDIIYTDTSIIPHFDTDEYIYGGGYKLFHWDYIPDEEITNLPEQFWLNIKNLDEDVWFYWSDQRPGIGPILQIYEGDTLSYVMGMGLCLVASNPCDAYGNGTQFIDGVEMGDISTTATGSNGYEDYTNLSTDVVQGESTQLIVSVPDFVSEQDDLAVWIDFNNNNSFNDDDEQLLCVSNEIVATNNLEILIPEDAPVGSHTMRIRVKSSGDDCGSPCGTTEFGEVEDYTINVVEPIDIEEADAIQFNVYPNPGTGLFNIETEGQIQIMVTNALGQIIHTQQILNSGTIDLKFQGKGFYHITAISKNITSTRSIIIE